MADPATHHPLYLPQEPTRLPLAGGPYSPAGIELVEEQQDVRENKCGKNNEDLGNLQAHQGHGSQRSLGMYRQGHACTRVLPLHQLVRGRQEQYSPSTLPSALLQP